jgi:hypothetical protein
MPALLAVAWLVPGAGLLLAGRLLPVPMVIVSSVLAVALCYFAMRRLPTGWPRFSGSERDVPAWALFPMMVIAAGFGLWQAFFRSGQVFAGGDPSAYLQYGYWIAVHGTARIPESAVSFGGAPGLAFAPAGFTVAGGSVTPALLPGLPLVLVGGAWLGGLAGALLVPAVVGGCAVLSFGGLVGRLCGAWQAMAGELVLAACLPEVYTARTPFAEPLVQVLLFGGLCLFTDSLAVRSRDGGGLALAGLGGLALGLTVLASAASLVLLLPALPVLAVLFAARRPQALPFGLGLFAGTGVGMCAGLMLARSSSTRHERAGSEPGAGAGVHGGPARGGPPVGTVAAEPGPGPGGAGARRGAGAGFAGRPCVGAGAAAGRVRAVPAVRAGAGGRDGRCLPRPGAPFPGRAGMAVRPVPAARPGSSRRTSRGQGRSCSASTAGTARADVRAGPARAPTRSTPRQQLAAS